MKETARNVFRQLGVIAIAVLVTGMATGGETGNNLLNNQGVGKGPNKWNLWRAKPVRKAVTYSYENGVYRIVNPSASMVHHIQLLDAVDLEAGTTYRFSFEAKAEQTPAKIRVAYSQQKKPFNKYGLADDAEVGTEWETLIFNFMAESQAADNPGVIRVFLGETAGGILLRNFELTEAE